MITRTAIFEGRPREGCEDRFYSSMMDRLVPLWRQFPHAGEVRWFRVVASDPDAPPIAVIQQIDYPSLAAMEQAIASPVRNQAREITLELMKMFEGRLYHVVSERNAAWGFHRVTTPVYVAHPGGEDIQEP